jgi:hypothetical protein
MSNRLEQIINLKLNDFEIKYPKKLQIVYDIDGKAIDVAIDSTLNLKQQVRELTKEINKTKEGTKEFSLLSAKLNETKDNVDRCNAAISDEYGYEKANAICYAQWEKK